MASKRRNPFTPTFGHEPFALAGRGELIASRIAVNETVVNEGLAVPVACAAIDAAQKPDVPMLMFVSDGSQTRAKDWVGLQHDYAAGLSNARVIELGCGHYVHNLEPARIAAEMGAFLGVAEERPL